MAFGEDLLKGEGIASGIGFGVGLALLAPIVVPVVGAVARPIAKGARPVISPVPIKGSSYPSPAIFCRGRLPKPSLRQFARLRDDGQVGLRPLRSRGTAWG